MITVLLTIHVLIAASLVAVILMQKSTGDAIGSASAGLMSGRGQGNVLTRTTAVLATVFFVTAILLAILAGHHSRPTSILDSRPVAPMPAAPARPSSGTSSVPKVPPGPAAPASPATAPVKPSAPSGPSVPLAK